MTGFLLALLATQQPRVEHVVPAKTQPHADDPAVIFYDDFDAHDPAAWKYMEPKPDGATLTRKEALGGRGGSMELFYAEGKKGRGNRKIVFGDSPIGRPVRRGETFDTVYWRHYVKHPADWQGGGPAKMSRATVMASSRWQQASILHVWSAGVHLTLDPATGVKGSELVTRRYNDFPNLRWLGNRPRGTFPVHGPEERGRWICIEACMKLNTPGQKNGYAALWVDGRLDAERKGMNFRGSYTGHGINAVFLEAYWNKGSPVDQARWYDDFVVSTKPIGPVTAEATPTLRRTAGSITAWEVEVGDGEKPAAWRSETLPGDARDVRCPTTLAAGVWFCRIRARGSDGDWTAWSPWHQPFVVR